MTSISQPIHPALQASVASIHVPSLDAQAAPAASYQVLPRPCLVLGLQAQGHLAVERAGQQVRLAAAGITGLQTTVRTFHAAPQTQTILVSLTPLGAFRLLGCAMHELVDAHPALIDLLPAQRVGALLGQLRAPLPPANATALITGWLLDLNQRARVAPHPAVAAALARLSHGPALCRIATLAHEVGLSRRQLSRLFREQVGLSPKAFASLVQWDWVMQRLEQGMGWAELAAAAGYADQAHLIRHFKQRTGLAPDTYRRARR